MWKFGWIRNLGNKYGTVRSDGKSYSLFLGDACTFRETTLGKLSLSYGSSSRAPKQGDHVVFETLSVCKEQIVMWALVEDLEAAIAVIKSRLSWDTAIFRVEGRGIIKTEEPIIGPDGTIVGTKELTRIVPFSWKGTSLLEAKGLGALLHRSKISVLLAHGWQTYSSHAIKEALQRSA